MESLLILSMLAFIVFLIMLIVALIRKRSKKIATIGMIISVFLFAMSITQLPASNIADEPAQENSQNDLPEQSINEPQSEMEESSTIEDSSNPTESGTIESSNSAESSTTENSSTAESGDTISSVEEAQELSLDKFLIDFLDKEGIEYGESPIWISEDDEAEKAGDQIVSMYLIGSDNLTTNLIRKGMLRDTKAILSHIQNNPEIAGVISEICIAWHFPLTDAYGNTKNELVLTVLISRDKINKINFTNFSIENFKTVADGYFEHPAIQ